MRKLVFAIACLVSTVVMAQEFCPNYGQRVNNVYSYPTYTQQSYVPNYRYQNYYPTYYPVQRVQSYSVPSYQYYSQPVYNAPTTMVPRSRVKICVGGRCY